MNIFKKGKQSKVNPFCTPTYTQADLQIENEIRRELEYYAIPYDNSFCSVDTYTSKSYITEDERQAYKIIRSRNKLPDELKERLLSTLEERKQMHRVTKLNISISNDEIDNFLRAEGIDPSTF